MLSGISAHQTAGSCLIWEDICFLTNHLTFIACSYCSLQSVVSGQAEPDTFHITRKLVTEGQDNVSRCEFSITDKKIGSKSIQHIVSGKVVFIVLYRSQTQSVSRFALKSQTALIWEKCMSIFVDMPGTLNSRFFRCIYCSLINSGIWSRRINYNHTAGIISLYHLYMNDKEVGNVPLY